MARAHRITPAPNNKQAAHREDPSLTAPTEAALRRQPNALKHGGFLRMLEVAKNAPQMAHAAWSGVSKLPRRSPKASGLAGRVARFSPTNEQFHVGGRHYHIPHLGRMCMRAELRVTGRSCRPRSRARWMAGSSRSLWTHRIRPAVLR